MVPTLKKAEKLYTSKKYSEVIRLLEPQIYRFREIYEYYFLLGKACLHSKDLSGAFTYLKRANQLKSKDNKIILSLALVHLLKRETNEAIKYWFEVLDNDPKNRHARYGLEFVRKHTSSETFIFSLEDFKSYKRFIPEKLNLTLPFSIAGVIIIIIFVFFTFLFLKNSGFFYREPREGVTTLMHFESFQNITENTGSAKIILTEREIKEAYNKVSSYFNDYRDNLAQREINRLLLANSSKEIKNQLLLLSKYIKTPSFTSLKDNFSYKEVLNNPHLYEGCYVIWKGKISNVSRQEQAITVDLLVGYQDQRVLEGIVPVLIPFAVTLDPYFGYEILGKIQVKNNTLYLEAVSLHQLAP